jgi:hypothetical protein
VTTEVLTRQNWFTNNCQHFKVSLRKSLKKFCVYVNLKTKMDHQRPYFRIALYDKNFEKPSSSKNSQLMESKWYVNAQWCSYSICFFFQKFVMTHLLYRIYIKTLRETLKCWQLLVNQFWRVSTSETNYWKKKQIEYEHHWAFTYHLDSISWEFFEDEGFSKFLS